jgi:hypothetical protein
MHTDEPMRATFTHGYPPNPAPATSSTSGARPPELVEFCNDALLLVLTEGANVELRWTSGPLHSAFACRVNSIGGNYIGAGTTPLDALREALGALARTRVPR